MSSIKDRRRGRDSGPTKEQYMDLRLDDGPGTAIGVDMWGRPKGVGGVVASGGAGYQGGNFAPDRPTVGRRTSYTSSSVASPKSPSSPAAKGLRGPERFFYDKSTYTGVHNHGGPSTMGNGGRGNVTLNKLCDRSTATVRGLNHGM
uniref:Uncharacterized protein n=1 Tax=Chromera velia CCMP2878 TaxID=1169474 RepID=A0A0G4FG65_9ALVE|mmetsp:Transcript_47266/g.93267  ORF Transcript_47266/g.93267 Transcript_47266/m.93267 type:complete len:146 (+) Transcript_47266:141-578(+)|eukprot:Cvel_16849.t1-p1 / transcript=Cvel_16849.t1 / gene=Cvel_16849 / organism=Chromera_velia_CCMP2878 / gene_product=hypothetical protein / transcript_product=hypothetical protein / location=Cvel_scaffold1317:41329-42002(-) / protein_length=145 / sequence_SO=supercontig / SO=protein_coding / is_pseudo=false